MKILNLTLIAAIATIFPAGATVTLYNTGRQYASRPASFGMSFEYGLQYEALLQIVEGDEHLCHGKNDTMFDSQHRPVDDFAGIGDFNIRHLKGGAIDADVAKEIQVNEGIKLETGVHENNKNGTDDKIHVVPSHGVPGKSLQLMLFCILLASSNFLFYLQLLSNCYLNNSGSPSQAGSMLIRNQSSRGIDSDFSSWHCSICDCL
jgi:hypothetical protein